MVTANKLMVTIVSQSVLGHFLENLKYLVKIASAVKVNVSFYQIPAEM